MDPEFEGHYYPTLVVAQIPKISIYLPDKAANMVDAVREETGAFRSAVIQSAIHMSFDRAARGGRNPTYEFS